MKPIIVERKVDADGVLRLEIPVGVAEAGRPVEVRATLLPWPMTPEQYRAWVTSFAGSWEGDFERPEQLPYEEREPFP